MNQRIRFYASLGWAGDTREEVVDMVEEGWENWDDMSIADQEKAREEFYENWVSSYLDAGWHEDES